MINIGTSGWSYDHWIGKFYPPGMAKTKWLGFYTNYFKTVELNMTFYRSPSLKAIEKWIYKTPDDFHFSYKASRIITHNNRLTNSATLLQKQQDILDRFKGKISCVLYQLPPSFPCNESNLKIVDTFLNKLHMGHHSVIEFRHRSWWNDETVELLKGRAIFCTVIGLGMPTNFAFDENVVYMRLHGDRYHGSYSEKWLNDLADQIRPLKDSHEIYIYFNNDIDCCAVENGKSLKNNLK